MKSFAQRRISDVSFVIDKDLNVSEGNRSFLKLFNITDPTLQLSNHLSSSDSTNLKHYLEKFNSDNNNPYFIANIFPEKSKPDSFKSCLFYIELKSEKLFKVDVKELSYSKVLLDKALLESREYNALLKNFDTDYFIYDGKEFSIKNTKDGNIIFRGTSKEFRNYFTNTLSISDEENDSQFDLLVEDSLNFVANKNYKFFQNDRKLITVHTVKTSTRDCSLIIGSITKGESRQLAQNVYSETKDGLTDLYNKKAITELAVKKINESKSPVSLIILDVDKFKECNDTYGHSFGDKVLVSVSQCIKDAINGAGIAGRIGGDEFLVILDKTDESDIKNITRNICVGIQWCIESENPESVVTCSMGIARAPIDATNYDDLFKIADKCLYIAKDKGRNCYIIYKPEVHGSIVVNTEKNSNMLTTSEYYLSSADIEYSILEAISNIKNIIESKKDTSIQKILDELCKYIHVSAVSIYQRNKELNSFERILFSENTNDMSQLIKLSEDMRKTFLNLKNSSKNDYFKYFIKNFLHLDNTNVLYTLDKTKYDMYTSADIASTVEVYNNDILVCYDVFKPARTFKKEKIIFATLAAKLISELF